MQIKGEMFSRQFIPKLLDGTKIRTSRPVKNVPREYSEIQGIVTSTTGNNSLIGSYMFGLGCQCVYRKPKYQPGDIIYVRETWQKACNEYIYLANAPEWYTDKWRPSIHMPREAARIFLRVTDVKVQQLDDLTEQDAIQDGFELEYHGWSPSYYDPDSGGDGNEEVIMALDKFKEFWKSKYGADAKWMWVYCFERCEKPE